MTDITVFLLVWYLKKKRFHPSKVKLRKTHHKTILVDNERVDVRNMFTVNNAEIREFMHFERTLGQSRFDYTVSLGPLLCKWSSDVLRFGVGFRGHYVLKESQDPENVNLEIEMTITDYFGRTDLLAIKLNSEETERFSKENEFRIITLQRQKIPEMFLEINCYQAAIRIPERQEILYRLSPDEQPWSSQDDLPIGLRELKSDDKETQFDPVDLSEFFSYDHDCGFESLITYDLRWLLKEITRQLEISETAEIDVRQGIEFFANRVATYLEPPIVFHVLPIVESLDHLPYKDLAVTVYKRFQVLKCCDLSSQSNKVQFLEAIQTDWCAVLKLVREANRTTVQDSYEKRMIEDRQVCEKLLKLKYRVHPGTWNFTSLFSRLITKDFLFPNVGEEKTSKCVGKYTSWRFGDEIHFYNTKIGEDRGHHVFQICEQTAAFR